MTLVLPGTMSEGQRRHGRGALATAIALFATRVLPMAPPQLTSPAPVNLGSSVQQRRIGG